MSIALETNLTGLAGEALLTDAAVEQVVARNIEGEIAGGVIDAAIGGTELAGEQAIARQTFAQAAAE